MDPADPQRVHPLGRLSETPRIHPGEHRRAAITHRRASAAHAGLRYVTDDQGGITRKRVGTGWAYYLPDGARITDRRERKRINSLAIPPAWTQVWICPDPAGHIQATARDARGRKQYRYHPAYRDARDHSKFRHMLEFSEVLPTLRERIEQDLRAPDHSRRQLLATVVRLLDRTLIRVGNDEYARENKSFGLTTLRRRHVRVYGETVRFTFRGKSRVEHSIMLEDPRLARIIQRCQDLPGHELFQYLDAEKKRQAISSDDVNAYLRELTGRDVTAKDFRTWGGTMLAAVELRAMGLAASRREADRNTLRAIDAVAERLGNTRAVCRKYYVHPELLRAYLMGDTVPLPEVPGRQRDRRRHREAASLRRDEIIVLKFLQERIREPS
jgi:DNA topoisomerase-1